MKQAVKSIAKSILASVPVGLRRNILFFRGHGRFIPADPVSFSEKIQWRILRDRRSLITRGGDKLAMKKHARESCSQVLIPETLWSGTDLNSIYHRNWGGDWVLKPISGSGYSLFGSGSLADSLVDLDQVRKWRYLDSYRVFGEWAYGQAPSGYLIERRIPTADGQSPHDLRFFVFAGEVKVIQLDSPRASAVERRFYSPDWEALPYEQGGKSWRKSSPGPLS